MPEIQYEDFTKVEIRVGKVLRAEPFPKARKPAIKLWMDFGPYGEKKSSAQLTKHYTPEDLVGRLVIAVTRETASAPRHPMRRVACGRPAK